MTLQHEYGLDDSTTESVHAETKSREASRQQKLKFDKWDHMSAIYYKLDQSMSRTASYLREEQAATAERRANKRLSRAHKQPSSIEPVEHQQARLAHAKLHKSRASKQQQQQQQQHTHNTAHSTPSVDPVTGLTWQERRVERQRRRRQQQQQLTHEWAEKMEILMEAHVPERLILPLLRKYEGDVSAVLAYHASYHQQRVQAKHHAQQHRVKKSYADTTLAQSFAAQHAQAMLLATDPTLSHLHDVTLV